MTRSSCRIIAILAAIVGFTAGRSSAAVIFDTGLTETFFGWVGFDIYPDQSVGVAFSPAYDCTLDKVGAWIMSNDFESAGRTYTLKLVTDASATNYTIPNVSNVLESWSMATAAVGWLPVLDQANSSVHPLLTAGSVYWLVAESTEPGGLDPVWVQAGNEIPLYSGSNNSFNPNGWEAGYSFGSTPGTVIEATAVPEPSMVGLGAAAMIIAALRRARR